MASRHRKALIVCALRDDAAERGWPSEVARHTRVAENLAAHLNAAQVSAETAAYVGWFNNRRLYE